MEEHLVLEYNACGMCPHDIYPYIIRLSTACRISNERKAHAEWPEDHEFVPVGNRIALPYIGMSESPKRPADGVFHGYQNRVWIITQEEWNDYAELNANRKKSIATAGTEGIPYFCKKRYDFEVVKTSRTSKLDSWETIDKIVTDVGGETHLYTHNMTISGRTYTFTERSFFDFGRVINPDYEIAPGCIGGFPMKKDGAWWWMLFDDQKGGWVPVREMAQDEAYCFEIVWDFGKIEKNSMRM